MFRIITKSYSGCKDLARSEGTENLTRVVDYYEIDNKQEKILVMVYVCDSGEGVFGDQDIYKDLTKKLETHKDNGSIGFYHITNI